jgi:Phosphate-induced protein 1 conserved region
VRITRFSACVVAAAAAAALSVPAAVGAPKETAPPGVAHAIRGATPHGVPGAHTSGGAAKSSNGISYHGGPVMTNGVRVYVIWYGDWTGDSATTILPALLGGIGGSPYYNVNTTYSNGAGVRVPNSVTLAAQTTDAYSQGKSNLSDAQINAIVSRAITTNALPKDANGLYFVLTSVDVTKSGFLTQYCGWHTHATIGGADVKYAFVGNPGANAACSVQTTTSPNGNPGADAMASVVAHELEETATDPDLNAWYDQRGYENADKCAWTFGTTYSVANGSKANMKLGNLDFLIQRNWVNASGGYCGVSY